MLTALRSSDDARAFAWTEEKSQGPWVCPECARAALLRKGRIKSHHFAHKPPVLCEYGRGETEAHRKCKTAIFEALRAYPGVSNADIEHRLGAVRPDVYAVFNGQPIAIEVQRSQLTIPVIEARTEAYHRLNVPVLWLSLWRPELATQKCTPKAWEKWLHAAQMGRAYYWADYGDALDIVPVHFADFLLDVTEYDGHGGYTKRSRRWRTPQPLLPARHVLSDFSRHPFGPYGEGAMAVPARTIWLDRALKWW